MRFVADIAKRFRQDEDGAAMIEYTILIGLITAAVITLVVAVGLWVTGQWTTLCANIGAVCP